VVIYKNYETRKTFLSTLIQIESHKKPYIGKPKEFGTPTQDQTNPLLKLKAMPYYSSR